LDLLLVTSPDTNILMMRGNDESHARGCKQLPEYLLTSRAQLCVCMLRIIVYLRVC